MSNSPKRQKIEEQENEFFSNPIFKKGAVLKCKFENMKGWDGSLKYSDVLQIDRFKWKLCVRRMKQRFDEPSKGSVFLEFRLKFVQSQKTPKAWLCKIDGNYRILRKDAEDFVMKFSPKTCFNHYYKENFTNLLGDWTDFEKLGFLKDDCLEIEAHFDVFYYDFNRKISNFTNISISDASDVSEDVAIFHFNREILCNNSKFIQKFLSEQKTEPPSVRLKGCEDYKLAHFLATMCSIPLEVREENYEFLLKLAGKFDVPALRYKCEQFSMNRGNGGEKFENATISVKQLSPPQSIPKSITPFKPNPIVKKGNILRWQVDNINEWDGKIRYSDKLYTDDVVWKIGSSLTDCFLSVELLVESVSKNINGNQWLIKVDGRIRMLNHKNPSNDYVVKLVPRNNLHSGMLKFGCGKFKMTEHLAENRYVKENSIIFEIDIDYTFYDFSTKLCDTSNITLNVKDCVFHFNKDILCTHSQFFYDKLYKNSEKSEDQKILVENTEPHHFLQFLATMCPVPIAVSEANFVQLATLANRFLVSSLQSNCESFLIECCGIPISKKICYAESFEFEELMKNCLDCFKTTIELKEFVSSEHFPKLKDPTKIRVLLCFMRFP
ncbi:unnamed protein product [Caenorhabditis angaria]|uniref:BTB domain-containing protein n=1 Tax=Caenorhabditis angaria TaxID=860376 RepID=A0A9P1I7T8_9PELO|nr:unnamed protein product [Caenorhabditis angaria]